MFVTDAPTARISILTFGDCYVSSLGRVINHPQNFLRISTYVLLEGRGKPVLRRRIGNLIWSDNGSKQANADIRQTIVRIRKFQEENNFQFLAADPHMAWLDPDPDIYFDLAEFVDLVANPSPQGWVRMCAIYNGDLLASAGSVGEGYEEWLAYQRSAMHHDFVSAISQAVLPDSPLSAHERHLCASRLLQVDPYHEGAHRALMYDAAASGQFSFVRQLYEECTTRLRSELNVEPDDETVRLYHKLISKTGTH